MLALFFTADPLSQPSISPHSMSVVDDLHHLWLAKIFPNFLTPKMAQPFVITFPSRPSSRWTTSWGVPFADWRPLIWVENFPFSCPIMWQASSLLMNSHKHFCSLFIPLGPHLDCQFTSSLFLIPPLFLYLPPLHIQPHHIVIHLLWQFLPPLTPSHCFASPMTISITASPQL